MTSTRLCATSLRLGPHLPLAEDGASTQTGTNAECATLRKVRGMPGTLCAAAVAVPRDTQSEALCFVVNGNLQITLVVRNL